MNDFDKTCRLAAKQDGAGFCAWLLGPNSHLVTFRFQNYGHVDGLDFHTTCAPSITFSYSRAGHTLPSERVFVGDHKMNPATDPFRITRTE